jgi:hypothetical protein
MSDTKSTRRSCPSDKDKLKGNPVFEFLRHTRNAASHRNS